MKARTSASRRRRRTLRRTCRTSSRPRDTPRAAPENTQNADLLADDVENGVQVHSLNVLVFFVDDQRDLLLAEQVVLHQVHRGFLVRPQPNS